MRALLFPATPTGQCCCSTAPPLGYHAHSPDAARQASQYVKRILTLLAGLLPVVAGAALPDLTPVTARYKVTVNGIPAGTAATVSVRSLGGTRHEASFHVRNRFFNHHEVSRFDWQACHVTAREYAHDFSGLGIERHSALTFDQARSMAVETRGDKRQEIPLAAEVTDSLNMAMLARCRLRDGVQNFMLPVVYRGERKDLTFKVVGKERVNTPAGSWDAVVVARDYPQGGRRTRVWVAPELDWFMVRFEHVENPVARGSMVLTEFINSVPVTTAHAPAHASPTPATAPTASPSSRTEATP